MTDAQDEARAVVAALRPRLQAALAGATPDTRYAAIDAEWRGATRLERRALVELLIAHVAGYR